jgi:hypothetical protein
MRWIPFVLVGLLGCGQEADTPYLPYDFVDHIDSARAELNEHRFRSFRPYGRLSSQVTLGLETRKALVPPIPSAFGFDVDVPADPVLRFAIAVSTLGQPNLPVPVAFRVRVEDGEDTSLVFDGAVRRRKPNVWLDQEVDLTPWSGSRVRLVFETSSSKAPDDANVTLLPYWGNPVLSSRSETVNRPNLILISRECIRADHLGVYGYERATTPRIDDFAADAVVFETATSASSTRTQRTCRCSPGSFLRSTG